LGTGKVRDGRRINMKECNAANGQNNHQHSNRESNKAKISSLKQIISLLCLTFGNITE
jgi:hypothetical protein